PAARSDRLSGRDGDGRREAGPAARLRRRPLGAGRADGRDDLRARPEPGAVREAREQGAEDGDPVRAVPRAGRARGALLGPRGLARVLVTLRLEPLYEADFPR